MKLMKRISSILFGLSFGGLFLLLLGIPITWISEPILILSVILFGGIAMLINLINVKSSKHSPTYTIVYWIALILILIGIGIKMMHWPGSLVVILSGLILLFISFLLPKKKKEPRSREDLLDNF